MIGFLLLVSLLERNVQSNYLDFVEFDWETAIYNNLCNLINDTFTADLPYYTVLDENT